MDTQPAAEKVDQFRKTSSEGYVKLSEALPLDTPLKLMIDPANACNFKCHFCPTGHDQLLKEVNRPKGVMDFGLFCKIIDDASRFLSLIHI